MKFRNLFVAALLGFSTATLPAAAPRQTAAQQVMSLMDAWADARVKGDVAFLERFYANEMWIQATDGSVVTREADIANFATGTIKPTYIRDEDLSTRIYRDVAVLTGVEKLGGTYKGVAREGAVRFTRVLIRRKGQWQLLLSQGTWITPKK